jgi:hypothetical protein
VASGTEFGKEDVVCGAVVALPVVPVEGVKGGNTTGVVGRYGGPVVIGLVATPDEVPVCVVLFVVVITVVG